MTPKTKVIVAHPWVFIPARELSSFQATTPGLYFRTSICVVQADCPKCDSKIGEPCKGKLRAYQAQPHREREWEAAKDKLPRPGRLARVEIHFNDLDSCYGPGSTGQHESVKVCWPVKERAVASLRKEGAK